MRLLCPQRQSPSGGAPRSAGGSFGTGPRGLQSSHPAHPASCRRPAPRLHLAHAPRGGPDRCLFQGGARARPAGVRAAGGARAFYRARRRPRRRPPTAGPGQEHHAATAGAACVGGRATATNGAQGQRPRGARGARRRLGRRGAARGWVSVALTLKWCPRGRAALEGGGFDSQCIPRGGVGEGFVSQNGSRAGGEASDRCPGGSRGSERCGVQGA
jgi:hypothetical protein